MKRFLITTALEETWRDDEPVLFLGEWCRLYSRKDRWSKIDAEITDDISKNKGNGTQCKEFMFLTVLLLMCARGPMNE